VEAACRSTHLVSGIEEGRLRLDEDGFQRGRRTRPGPFGLVDLGEGQHEEGQSPDSVIRVASREGKGGLQDGCGEIPSPEEQQGLAKREG
jgi:hypothetical protein